MKTLKKYGFLFVLLLLPGIALAQEFDPRLGYGGYTPQEVYQAESGIYHGMSMHYESTMLAYPIMIDYLFDYNAEKKTHNLVETRMFPMMQHTGDDIQQYYTEALTIAEHYNTYIGQPTQRQDDFLEWQLRQVDILLRYNLPSWQIQYNYNLTR